ncbi:UPF0339 protein [Alcaligenes pakistanensis]|uniref:UPF0339 protein n=1 Tax=Alcaligenes pakistanensis TaxID=1482717 RepID=A0A8H9IM94_9BURK|nr:YegP family protein [Alcaligenes pakistanensis]GHC59194.1 UPF0339 protein [Alcaligenes pakistanensis]
MKFVLYKDKGGEWRWRFKAANGNIICVSSEGYTSKQSAQHSIESVKKGMADAPVVEE